MPHVVMLCISFLTIYSSVHQNRNYSHGIKPISLRVTQLNAMYHTYIYIYIYIYQDHRVKKPQLTNQGDRRKAQHIFLCSH
jgi:hypothetical protein